MLGHACIEGCCSRVNRALLLEGLTKSGRTWPVFGAYKLRSATSNCLFCSAAAFTALSRHVQVGLPLVGDDKYGEASPASCDPLARSKTDATCCEQRRVTPPRKAGSQSAFDICSGWGGSRSCQQALLTSARGVLSCLESTADSMLIAFGGLPFRSGAPRCSCTAGSFVS